MSVRVLHLSTHDEACGIGRYQEMFLSAMVGDVRIENEFFEVSPSRIPGMDGEARAAAFARLGERMREFDVLHVQHEFTYFPNDTLADAGRAARSAGKRFAVTVHTGIAALDKFDTPFNAHGPRSLLKYLKDSRRTRAWKVEIVRQLVDGLTLADLVLVHNEKTKADLVASGVPASKFSKLVIPVPVAGEVTPSDEIARHLRRGPNDVVVSVVGFINRHKGTVDAVEAIALLPQNYKLAIIGGLHPMGSPPDGDQGFLDGLIHRIDELGLTERVYITGYVEDEARLNALVRECDLCVYPYHTPQYDNSSSAALNNAFANARPVIVYPTKPFKELNDMGGRYLEIAEDFTPQEIARTMQAVDLPNAERMSREFSERFSYPVVAAQLVDLYAKL